METKLINPDGKTLNSKRQSFNKKPPQGSPDEAGILGRYLGTGDNAKNSIVWLTIKWNFFIGCAITAGVYFKPVFCDFSANFVEDLKSIWAIFMPVITLALGYIFGRNR